MLRHNTVPVFDKSCRHPSGKMSKLVGFLVNGEFHSDQKVLLFMACFRKFRTFFNLFFTSTFALVKRLMFS